MGQRVIAPELGETADGILGSFRSSAPNLELLELQIAKLYMLQEQFQYMSVNFLIFHS